VVWIETLIIGPHALNIYLIPTLTVKKSSRTKSFDKPQSWLAHSAPAALFVDKWITRLVTHLPTKVMMIIDDSNLKVSCKRLTTTQWGQEYCIFHIVK